jgi:hypothetical protein
MNFKYTGKFNTSDAISVKTFQFDRSLAHIKRENSQGEIHLTTGQKIIRKIKDIFSYIPMVITACIIEKFLFPKKNYNNSSWDPYWAYSGGSLSGSIGSGCGCCEFDVYVPCPYEDSKYLISSHEGTTALEISKLKDGYTIDKVPHDNSKKKLILYFQGNGQTLENFHLLKKIEGNAETNTAFCMADWPKHGSSKGALNHETMLKQAELAYQFAVNQLGYSDENIIVKGLSLGCHQALSLAERHPKIARLELDQPFTNMQQISRAADLSNSEFNLCKLIGSLMKRAIQYYYNFDNMSDLSYIKNFTGEIKITRRTNDDLTSLNEKDLVGSCLTNDIIKKIIEEKHGTEFKASTVQERNQWMDAYLSTEHLKEDAKELIYEGDHSTVVNILKQLVTDSHVNIGGN